VTYRFPDCVLLVFCKAPLAGLVKTRLQPALTAEQAVQAHIELTRMTLARAFLKPLCPVILCCAPDGRHPFFRQCARQYPLKLAEQRGRDLGERMHNALADALLAYRHAVLVGCDCPSLSAEDLRRAFTRLRSGHDAVIAPAEDGGYVLIGLNAPRPDLFNDMAWGGANVMAETRRRLLSAGLNAHELGTQWDVDTLADWRRYRHKDMVGKNLPK